MERTIKIKTENQVFELLFKEDEISWQSILYELVRTEQMDPWDIDISALTKSYIETIKKLQEINFRITGKVLLAAAILLHLKSTKFLEEDISNLNNLMNPPEEILPEDETFYEQGEMKYVMPDKLVLIPRTPQPRKRKVSIYDLIDSLQKALEVKQRRILRFVEIPKIDIPQKKVDITKIIFNLYNQIKDILNEKEKIYFHELVQSDKKEDKIYTFVPLLHLATQRKIDLDQEFHLGDIEIRLAGASNDKKEGTKENESGKT